MLTPSDVLDQYGFGDFVPIERRRSVADLFPHRQHRCGLYVLRFANGEHYAGLARDVTRRYCQHAKIHPDISGISFVEIPLEALNETERRLIEQLEQSGCKLRNITYLSEPMIDSDLDDLVSESEQQRFLCGESGVEPATYRVADSELRRKYRLKYDRFAAHSAADAVVRVYREYVGKCVPFPRRTELTFWAVSCKPGPGRKRFQNLLMMNVNWQEVSQCVDDDGVLGFNFHLARSVIKRTYYSIGGFQLSFENCEVDEHAYAPGGPDQFRVHVTGEEAASQLLANQTVVDAIRLLNLRLMRKGPTTHGRFHCFDLADRLLETDIHE
ncbi:MAG: hypothetical protein K1X57_13585 [Gemmataceae bacterium]|nr:hypothetical protein [Gemmataceae bacterium]